MNHLAALAAPLLSIVILGCASAHAAPMGTWSKVDQALKRQT